MARSSKKCEKNQAINKEKLKKVAVKDSRFNAFIICLNSYQAIEQGNMEGAKIYAQVNKQKDVFYLFVSEALRNQNVIREKNQALNFLRLGSRIDAVASRLETAIRTH